MLDRYFLPPLLSPDGLSVYLWLKTEREWEGEYFNMRSPFTHDAMPVTRFTVTLSRELRDTGGIETGTTAGFTWSTPLVLDGKYDYALPVLVDVYNTRAIKEENTSALSPFVAPGEHEYSGNKNANGFGSPGGENWVYFVFQCKTLSRDSNKKLVTDPPAEAISNLPVLGLRVYESRPGGTITWTEDTVLYRAEPGLAASLGNALFREAGYYASFDTPVYIVRYKVRGAGYPVTGPYTDRQVKVYFYPITPLDAIDTGLIPGEGLAADWMSNIVRKTSYGNKQAIADARKQVESEKGDLTSGAKYDVAWIKEFNFFFGDD